MYDRSEYENKIALVTGGSRGIGRAVSLAFAERGMHVAICGRTQADLDRTCREIEARGVRAWSIPADVSRREDIETLVDHVRRDAGRIDVLVNNAVTSTSAPFDELTDDLFRYHIDVKLMAYIRIARLVLEDMKPRNTGRIINIGGMTARIVAPLRMTNGVVNAGVANFTKQFAGYAARHGVTVNCIHPGYTVTERMMRMFEREAKEANSPLDEVMAQRTRDIPLGKLVQPEDIAAAAVFFASAAAGMITGQSIAVDGGSGEAINY
jgi:3-oxoacyl-[acyl-carrier protein] reductase